MGKPLGVTAEAVEYVAAQTFNLAAPCNRAESDRCYSGGIAPVDQAPRLPDRGQSLENGFDGARPFPIENLRNIAGSERSRSHRQNLCNGADLFLSSRTSGSRDGEPR
jgi:hypothetical protein